MEPGPLGCERDGIFWFRWFLDGQFGLAQPGSFQWQQLCRFSAGHGQQLTNQRHWGVCVVAVYALLGILCPGNRAGHPAADDHLWLAIRVSDSLALSNPTDNQL